MLDGRPKAHRFLDPCFCALLTIRKVMFSPAANVNMNSRKLCFYLELIIWRIESYTLIVVICPLVETVPCEQQVESWESDSKVILLVQIPAERVLRAGVHNALLSISKLKKELKRVMSDAQRECSLKRLNLWLEQEFHSLGKHFPLRWPDASRQEIDADTF